MGRPKGQKKKADRSPEDRVGIIHVKGTVEYAEWLEAAHLKTRLPKATIFRIGVELWAESVGLPKPPSF